MIRTPPAAFLGLFLAAAVPAQGLELEVRGGTLPGQIDMSLRGGLPFQQWAAIILSVTTGPTPLALLDPTDPRSLRVGLELLDIAQIGPFLANGAFTPPSLPIPNNPSLLDQRLLFQGLSLPSQTRLVDEVSAPRAVWFGPGGVFSDRLVGFLNARSFFPVLPSADGRFLLAGGGAGAIFAQAARRDTEWYDPLTDAFQPGPDLTIERSLHTATELLDGRWLLAGGVNRTNDPQATAEIWDPVAQTFTAVASMATGRMGHAATRLPDGRVLVSGGITDLNAPNTPIDPVFSVTRSVEIYNPVTNTWTTGPQLSKPRAGHASFARADGRLVLAGGVSWYTFIIRIPTIEASSDIYDPTTNQMASGPALRQARAQGTTLEVSPGRWLLAGGVGTISLTQWGTPTAAAEVYDEAANTFTATGSMSQARALHIAYPLGNGEIMQIGGGDGTLFALTPLQGVEVYDVATGRFRAGPSLTRPRAASGYYETTAGQLHILGGDTLAGVDNTSEFFYR
jgi:hypothetical protein